MRKIIWLAGSALMLCALPVQADTKLVYESGDKPFTVKIRPGEIRIDDAGDRWQLYRQSTNTIYSVEPEARAYTKMDENTAEAIRAQMQSLRERMDKRLSELPPAQREQAKQMLAQQVPGLDGLEHETSVERTGNTDSVAGYECEVVRILRDGEPRETLCVARPEILGMSKEEFETISAMFSLMDTMLAGTGLDHVGLPYLNLGGMPIRYQDKASDETRLLTEVSHEDLPALAFQIPPDYQVQHPQGVPR